MNKQKNAKRLENVGWGAAIAAGVFGFCMNITGFLVLLSLAFALMLLAGQYSKPSKASPIFFTFDGTGGIYTNLTVVMPLLDGDRTNLSVEEVSFLGYCQYCRKNKIPYPFTICHPGVSTMSQNDICKYLLDGVITPTIT